MKGIGLNIPKNVKFHNLQHRLPWKQSKMAAKPFFLKAYISYNFVFCSVFAINKLNHIIFIIATENSSIFTLGFEYARLKRILIFFFPNAVHLFPCLFSQLFVLFTFCQFQNPKALLWVEIEPWNLAVSFFVYVSSYLRLDLHVHIKHFVLWMFKIITSLIIWPIFEKIIEIVWTIAYSYPNVKM